ncbi:HrpF/NolX family T3SS translocon protein [Pandoraea anhela]|nr:HrpF/NolX family T3SS translocon protein [Pandoraea anhela]
MRVGTSSPALAGLESALEGAQDAVKDLETEISGMLGGAAGRIGLPQSRLVNAGPGGAENLQPKPGQLEHFGIGLVVPNGAKGAATPAARTKVTESKEAEGGTGASGASDADGDDDTVKDENGKPIPMFTADGFYNPAYAQAKIASIKAPPSDGHGDAGDDDDDKSFGKAARTLDAWMSTSPNMQGKGVSVSDLKDIANGTGVGAGAPDDVKQAAKAMLADGGERFTKEIAGKGGVAHQNNFADYVVADHDTPLSDEEIQTLAVLARHEDAVKGSTGDMINKINDPNTPPDLKAALQQFASDPILQQKLDAGKTGKRDGHYAGQDVQALISQHPEVQAYMQQQAETFTHNYIPSDDTSGNAQPRDMTADDAQHELFKYSDYLPKNISQQTLQDIVNGTGGEGKMPPQVIAAAKYYLDHPGQWQAIAGTGGSIKRGDLLNNISHGVHLTADETQTIQTIQNNSSAFFGKGDLTRDKLKSIANDSSQSDAVRKAAQKMLDDPALFGMLDNATHGNNGSARHAADDGHISKSDVSNFVKNSKTWGQTPPPTPPAHKPTTEADKAAVAAMQAGAMDQPAIKKEKGGALQNIGQKILHAFSKILEVFSTVLSFLGKIPGIGPLFSAASMAAEAVSGQLNVAAVAAGGGSKADILKAERDAAIGLGSAAVGLIAPGMGKAVMKGIVKGVETGVTAAAEAGAKAASTAVNAGTRAAEAGAGAAVEAGTRGAESTAGRAFTFAGHTVDRSAVTDALKDGVKDTVKDNVKEQVENQVYAAITGQNQNS